MIVDNANHFMSTDVAVSGRIYLVVTTDKRLYIVKRVGVRSWDAFNMDIMADVEHIHSNKLHIFKEIDKKLSVDYVMEYNDKVKLRKAIMEFMYKGGIGVNNFKIESVTPTAVKRAYAVYKEDGTDWTVEEYKNVLLWSGDFKKVGELDNIVLGDFHPYEKYIYDDESEGNFMNTWSDQSVDKLTKIEYKEIV